MQIETLDPKHIPRFQVGEFPVGEQITVPGDLVVDLETVMIMSTFHVGGRVVTIALNIQMGRRHLLTETRIAHTFHLSILPTILLC